MRTDWRIASAVISMSSSVCAAITVPPGYAPQPRPFHSAEQPTQNNVSVYSGTIVAACGPEALTRVAASHTGAALVPVLARGKQVDPSKEGETV